MNSNIYILGFSAFSGIGTIRFEQLINEFGTPEKAWNASRTDLKAVLKEAVGEKFDEFRKEFNLKEYAKEIEKKHIMWFTPNDKEYPKLLKQLNTVIPAEAGIQSFGLTQDKEDGSRVKPGMTRAPFILFAKGNTDLLKNEKTIGIVGTRKVTDYGQQVTEMFTKDLVNAGFTIVSGMALGVDGIAHTTAIQHGGKTIAVLGSGVDIPTPGEHSGLYQQILEHDGLIVSTFSPGEDANKGSFPARNATVAGLSQGIVVTEGAEKSGALITANYAKKFGRPVFSVPGQITSQLSIGTNNLIKQGAVPVTAASGILDTLGIIAEGKSQVPNHKKQKADTKEERIILDLLENGPLHFDEIVRTIGKDSRSVGSILSLMELKGVIKSNSKGEYIVTY